MENDKVCPICGGLIIYIQKHYSLHTINYRLCLHCGYIEVEV
jgi:predicted RNA-binding Zn-ribbon protein involved in translation (DUF1610 family)